MGILMFSAVLCWSELAGGRPLRGRRPAHPAGLTGRARHHPERGHHRRGDAAPRAGGRAFARFRRPAGPVRRGHDPGSRPRLGGRPLPDPVRRASSSTSVTASPRPSSAPTLRHRPAGPRPAGPPAHGRPVSTRCRRHAAQHRLRHRPPSPAITGAGGSSPRRHAAPAPSLPLLALAASSGRAWP